MYWRIVKRQCRGVDFLTLLSPVLLAFANRIGLLQSI
jgi:hypothetical protein